jgi:hypothetical protein
MDAHKISSQNSMLFERQKWQTCVLDALPDKINHDLSCSIAIFYLMNGVEFCGEILCASMIFGQIWMMNFLIF